MLLIGEWFTIPLNTTWSPLSLAILVVIKVEGIDLVIGIYSTFSLVPYYELEIIDDVSWDSKYENLDYPAEPFYKPISKIKLFTEEPIK